MAFGLGRPKPPYETETPEQDEVGLGTSEERPLVSPDANPPAVNAAPPAEPALNAALGMNAPPSVPTSATQAPKPVPLQYKSAQDYFSSPDTVKGMEKMYYDALMSFNNDSEAGEHQFTVDPYGHVNSTSVNQPGDTLHIKSEIPEDSAAIYHTHPKKSIPYPSPGDQATADKRGKPVFVITQRDIWEAAPGEKKPVHVGYIDQTKGNHVKFTWIPQKNR